MHFFNKFKIIFLGSLLLLGKCLAIEQEEDLKDALCIMAGIEHAPLKEEKLESFLDCYDKLEEKELNNILNEEERRIKTAISKAIFLSFKYPESPLYDALLDVIVRIGYEENEKIDKNSLTWKRFLSFLKFYELGSDNYRSLSEEDQQVIDYFHNRFFSPSK